MELHHLHVGDARPGPPRHRDPVPRRAARGGGELIHAPGAAGGEDGGAGDMAFDPAGGLVERIDPPHAASGREVLAVAIGDEVDAGAPRQQGDVGIGLGGLEQRRLHRPAGRVVDMDDPAVRMAALAGEVERVGVAVERHAQFAQPVDRGGRAFDHELHRLAIVQPRARHHRVANVIVEGVARIEHRGDPALRPGGRSAGQRALGQHQHLARFGQRQRRGQPRRARADDQHVMRLSHCILSRHPRDMTRISAHGKRDAMSHGLNRTNPSF